VVLVKFRFFVIIFLIAGIALTTLEAAQDPKNVKMYFFSAGYMILALEIVVLSLPKRSKKVKA